MKQFTRRQIIRNLGLGSAALMIGQSSFSAVDKKHIITPQFFIPR